MHARQQLKSIVYQLTTASAGVYEANQACAAPSKTVRHGNFKPFFIALLLIAHCAVSTASSGLKHEKNKPVAQKAIKKKKLARQATLVGPAYAQRADAMKVADEIAQQQDLKRAWVRRAIGQSHYLPQAAKFVLPPPVGTAKNWRLYRSRFIDTVRIQAGVKFWQDNRDTLARAQQETGVPAEIIVGIIGVETIFGQQVGTYRVMDALSTLAFDFPTSHPRAKERSEFFKNELAHYLTLTHRNQVDPMSLKGSFAGAMGVPQFMPSSWLKYAVDFDGDGKVDLFNSPADAIGSVAHYFKAFNWQPGMPTHYPVSFDPSRLDMEGLLLPDILPTFSLGSFTAKGAVLEGAALQHTGPLALIELQNGDEAPSYVAGTDNFYAITRYNWSSYYAMAVIELGEAIALEIRKRP